jgi:Ca-activated chloride channel homolog
MSEGAIPQTKTYLRGHYRMHCRILICFLLVSNVTLAQTAVGPQVNKPYKIEVSVDEISVIFHASGASGQSVGDLNASELDLFDNERGPGTIVALHKLKERPLRVGFIIDTSSSVSADIVKNRAIAIAAAQILMQKEADFDLAIGFRRSKETVQSWSNDLNAVMAGIRRIGSTAGSSIDGTSLFDSLFSTCFYEFGMHGDDNQNIVLLFSDGVDTASQTTLQKAVDMCQHLHTAIYAFAPSRVPGETSTGPETLRRLN